MPVKNRSVRAYKPQPKIKHSQSTYTPRVLFKFVDANNNDSNTRQGCAAQPKKKRKERKIQSMKRDTRATMLDGLAYKSSSGELQERLIESRSGNNKRKVKR